MFSKESRVDTLFLSIEPIFGIISIYPLMRPLKKSHGVILPVDFALGCSLSTGTATILPQYKKEPE